MTTITTLPALRAMYEPARERSVLKELPQLDMHAKRFIGLSPFAVLSTHGADGRADASPRGGEAGFVKVLDDSVILIPDAPGNNRLDSLENIIETKHLGLLFFVPGVDETLRVNGIAQLCTDVALLELCKDARRLPKLVIRVAVQSSYLHCAKALMRSELWNASKHVARSVMPSMGEMMRDQMADRMSPETVFETQEQMLVRYKQTL